MSDLFELIDVSPTLAVADAFVITNSKLKDPNYENIMVSISGGADSDIMIDMINKLNIHNKNIQYVFFNTGLEFQATKDHIKFLEQKYGIEIHEEKAVKPIPTCSRKHGQPFLSKQVSEFMMRLQKHGFKWEDEPFEELIKKYPKCKSALEWWCNTKGKEGYGGKSNFNIARNRGLKEFIIANPPTFNISNKCCYYAKKLPAQNYKKEHDINLSIVGVRKAEGGVRATAYKNCFTCNSDKDKSDEYRMLFWYSNDDRAQYESEFNVTHSKCYTEYGLKRTGCVGCPFAIDIEDNLKAIEKNEPKLYKAVNKIFGDSYEYTRKYREFAKQMKIDEKNGQLSIFDYQEA